MKRGQRPSKHVRRVKTRKGRRRVTVNPTIKKRVIKRSRRDPTSTFPTQIRRDRVRSELGGFEVRPFQSFDIGGGDVPLKDLSLAELERRARVQEQLLAFDDKARKQAIETEVAISKGGIKKQLGKLGIDSLSDLDVIEAKLKSLDRDDLGDLIKEQDKQELSDKKFQSRQAKKKIVQLRKISEGIKGLKEPTEVFSVLRETDFGGVLRKAEEQARLSGDTKLLKEVEKLEKAITKRREKAEETLGLTTQIEKTLKRVGEEALALPEVKSLKISGVPKTIQIFSQAEDVDRRVQRLKVLELQSKGVDKKEIQRERMFLQEESERLKEKAREIARKEIKRGEKEQLGRLKEIIAAEDKEFARLQTAKARLEKKARKEEEKVMEVERGLETEARFKEEEAIKAEQFKGQKPAIRLAITKMIREDNRFNEEREDLSPLLETREQLSRIQEQLNIINARKGERKNFGFFINTEKTMSGREFKRIEAKSIQSLTDDEFRKLDGVREGRIRIV